MASLLFCFLRFFTVLAVVTPAWAQLNPNYYDQICPEALPTVRRVVEQAVAVDPRMGASLLRLHFHDCFVNGCDGSILLDDTLTFTGEKTAGPNKDSARGFEVIDSIKDAVNSACYGNVVSCADILAVAARDSVVALGGASYPVQVGRRDARFASKDAANNNIPAPTLDLPALLANFQSHGLSLQDLVVLSGGHTIGLARCTTFRSRVYNETNIDVSFAATLRQGCPSAGGDNNLAPLDFSTTRVDTVYYQGLLQKKGLLHSDQQLYSGNGGQADDLVKYYSEDLDAFWVDFGVSMLKMGNISPLTGAAGEVRSNCRKVN
ncbi:hypothetical protein Taro_019882 [Colocasia esculenta]|uniref:Peroxidase n=1 Tax=Colocasia esculenta TaxID=4460 RepID=A0A843UM61_COLES|nr:hypothetical protein [Colocasia esculenta]